MACDVHGVGLCTAGCSKPPHESASAAEVTFAHRLATAETLRSTGNHVAVVNWIQTGAANEFLDENFSAVAQALADAEARGRASRDAELERVSAELADANAGLAQYAADIEGLGVSDAPWPETLEAIKAAMRIEKGAIVTDEQLAADIAIVHEIVRQPINSAEAYDLDAIHAFDRITAALAARGVK